MDDPLRLPHAEPVSTVAAPADVVEAILQGLAGEDTAVCVADENDDIRYASASFRKAFIPHFDGHPSNFMTGIETAIRAGTGIKLVSKPPEDFARLISERRRQQTGSYSFATDLVNGSWWWVSDIKLSNGWMVCIAQNISPLKRQEFILRDAHANAERDALTDSLTGIPNRRWGLRHAETLFEACRSASRPLSVALLDIDHFKTINDQHGHETGDRVLSHFARHMTDIAGSESQFSRLGGDEFLLVTPDTALSELEKALAPVLRRVPSLKLPGKKGGLQLSVSIGAAQLFWAETWPTLLRRADLALYQAKAKGRGRIACADMPEPQLGTVD